jgi:hypothetical protein
MGEVLRAGFIEWQKIFDCVNWTKLMQILKESGIERLNKKNEHTWIRVLTNIGQRGVTKCEYWKRN